MIEKSENSFSSLFYECSGGLIAFQGRSEYNIANPFVPLERCLEYNKDGLLWYQIRNYVGVEEVIRQIKEAEKQAQFRFELEYGLITNQNSRRYLNECLSYLIELFQRNQQKIIVRRSDLSHFLENLIRENILHIFNKYHFDVDGKNKHVIIPWMEIRKPIRSFRFHKNIELSHNHLKRTYNKYLHHDLIHYSTSFQHFKNFFGYRRLENRICWVHNVGSLKYFIQSLLKEEVIEERANNHWEITCEFFTLNGGQLNPKDFTKGQPTQNKAVRHKIDRFIKALKVQS